MEEAIITKMEEIIKIDNVFELLYNNGKEKIKTIDKKLTEELTKNIEILGQTHKFKKILYGKYSTSITLENNKNKQVVLYLTENGIEIYPIIQKIQKIAQDILNKELEKNTQQ